MQDLVKHTSHLPVKLEDLAKFVLVGREKLTAVRALIKAMDKIEVAAEVRKQKRDEAQMLAEALLDAEAKLGELAIEIPKGTGHQQKRGNRYKTREIDTAVDFSKTKTETIKELGFDQKQIERFQTLAENKDIIEQAKAEARENDDIVNRTMVLSKVKQKKREEDLQKQKKDIEEGIVVEPSGLYSVISIDPPWPYGREYDPDGSRVANPYPEMSIEDIKNIKLPLEKDSVILLWTTHAFLPSAFEILNTWGAQYKATLVWNKQKLGMGHWFRMQCEFCLVGIIGKPYWNNKKWPDIIEEKRREHSRKPDVFFDIVDEITAGKKLEYFSREKRQNWDNYGNEPEKF
jgi:N6-adenosine-specific RNA methylase IME4